MAHQPWFPATEKPFSEAFRHPLHFPPESKLVAGRHRFAALNVNLDHFFTLNLSAVLVSQDSDDLLRGSVDHVPGRGVGVFSVKAERDPARLFAQSHA